MSVHYPTTLKRYLHYRKKRDFVVVKCGSAWCSPCKKLTPILESMADKYKHVYFIDVDVDNPEIDKHEDLNNVKTLPHVKFFVNGILEREVIGLNLDKINRYVARYAEIKLLEKQETNQESDHELSDGHEPEKDDHEPEKEEQLTLESGLIEIECGNCPYCLSKRAEELENQEEEI